MTFRQDRRGCWSSRRHGGRRGADTDAGSAASPRRPPARGEFGGESENFRDAVPAHPGL